jgi:hypothetical protein
VTRSYCDRSLSALSPPLYSHRSHDSCIVRRLIASAPMRVHLYTLTAAPHVTSHRGDRSPPRAARSRRVASRHHARCGAAARRHQRTTNIPSPVASGLSSSMLLVPTPSRHHVTPHVPSRAEPCAAPSEWRRPSSPSSPSLPSPSPAACGWVGAESSRNERIHARIRDRRNGGAVARGVRAWAGWVGCLGRR